MGVRFVYFSGVREQITPKLVEDGPWGVSIGELNDRMRDALAAVPHDGCRSVAGRWATIEELAGWSADEVLAVLVDLCALARNAVEREHHLYCRSML
jgi:hypothetical protein